MIRSVGAIFESSAVFFPILAGGHLGVFPEDPGEMAVGGKAQIGADGREGLIRITEEAFGLRRASV